jgi:hypothetical protein
MRSVLYSFPVKLLVLTGALVAAVIIIGVRGIFGLNRKNVRHVF